MEERDDLPFDEAQDTRSDDMDPEQRRGVPAAEGVDASGKVSDAGAETVEALRAQMAQYKEEAERHWQQFLHAAADLENYKKQAARQREDAVNRIRASLLTVVLAVVDNLERALEHAHKNEGAEAILEGIRMTHRQVTDLLQNMGVRFMETVGKPFDPRFHEAIDIAGSQEYGVTPNTIVEEIQRGYLLNGEVLRPARVRVAK